MSRFFTSAGKKAPIRLPGRKLTAYYEKSRNRIYASCFPNGLKLLQAAYGKYLIRINGGLKQMKGKHPHINV